MRRLLSLPTPLLLLLDAATVSTASPEYGDIFAVRQPIAVRKMSGDPTEKFYPEFWQFEHEAGSEVTHGDLTSTDSFLIRPRSTVIDDQSETANSSFSIHALPPLLQHAELAGSPAAYFGLLPRNIFSKRGYQCPTGTYSCKGIGHPDVCCGMTEQCVKVQDQGIGSVGCCPDGKMCAGSVSACDTAAGYNACPNSPNGGCCIPNFQCDNVGCVETSKTTTVITKGTVVIAQTQTPPPPRVTIKTVVSTEVIIPSGVITSYVTTPTSTVVVGPSIQAISTLTTTQVTTVTASAPIRQTPNSSSSETTTAITTSAVSNPMCPMGYYQCSAFYQGGCCQVGQDCHTTHCPSRTTSTITSNGNVIIIVYIGEGITTISQGATAAGATTGGASIAAVTTTTPGAIPASLGSGACATGWYNCAANLGGGCCPSGYACSTNCVATQPNEPHLVNKAPTANTAASIAFDGMEYLLMVIAGFTGVGMVML